MEHHYFQTILTYLRAHPHAGELFTFLVAFSESLPLIGTVVPGTVTMTIVGILIGVGALPILFSLFIASLAAFAGDSIGFWVGYYYNERLRIMWPFKKHPKWLSMGEAFFTKHGGKSIILGRFIGPARSTVPLVAGLLRMTWLRFAMAAIPSAVLWAFMYMTPGIFLGALSREVPKGETTRFFLYGLSVLIIIWLAFWLIQHFFIQLARGINYLTDRCWDYLTRNDGGRFFIRLITNQQKKSDHHQLTLSLTAILSAIVFLILLISVRHHGALTEFNKPVFHALQAIRTPLWNKIFSVITLMGEPKTILAISVFITLGLSLKKQWRSAIHFLAAIVLASGSVIFFKAISHSLRPQGFEKVALSSSFPSGHTALSFVIFCFLAFLITQIVNKNYRWIPWTLAGILIISVGFSRLYLGAHWFADIMGSVLLGTTILLMCIVSYRRMPKKINALTLSPLAITVLLCVSLGVPWSVNITRSLTNILGDTTPIWPIQRININAWWQSPLQYTPLYRNNRLGIPYQPFNVQWQGSLQQIAKTLEKKGWKSILTHQKFKLKNSLQRFSSLEAEYHMPLLAWLYHDKPPVIVFIKHIPKQNRVIELHLWESDIVLQPHNKPLWIGAIDIRIPPKKLLSFKNGTHISLLGNEGLDKLYKDTAHFNRKFIYATVEPQIKAIHQLGWRGKILLIRSWRCRR